MTSCLRSGVLVALLASLTHAQGSGLLDLNPTIVRAADRDGEGVSSEEWAAFKARLREVAPAQGGPAGALDRRLVLTSLIASTWDQNGDGIATVSDLAEAFEGLDADQSRSVTLSELSAGAGGFARFFAFAILFRAADFDENAEVTREEWDGLFTVGDGFDGIIPLVGAYEWIAQAQAAPPPADKNAITPGVYLLTLDAALDADYNGVLDESDLDQIYAHADRNRDGVVSADELRPQRVGRSAGGAPRAPARARELTEPLMPWQRNLEDALAVARRTGKPLLICVNIDGESASEVLASFQYRDPEFAALAAGFVPVLFSPDQHNPREHDDRGRRIPDPKFGRVITSEHTDNEPELYERYFGGTRVAPRHVGVTADGELLFDVKLVNDLSIIDRALERHGVFDGGGVLDPSTAGEQELLDSPDAACRDRLEELFASGDERTRARLAGLCLSSARETQHPEVLRMALLDESSKVRMQAVWTAIQHPERVPTELLLPAFRAAEGEPEQLNALVTALRRVVDEVSDEPRRKRAMRLQRVFTALQHESDRLDVDRWRLALAFAPRSEELEPAEDQIQAVSRRLSELEARLAESPADRELNLLFADSLMRLARIQMMSGGNPTYLFEDVRAAAALATSDESPNGRALGFLAWSNFLLSDDSAVDYAAQALPLLRQEAGSPLAAQVLQIFAQGRLSALYQAMSAETEWPLEWIADIRDVYEVLLLHPLVTEKQVIDYLGFLEAVEAHSLQAEAVRRGIALFPSSTQLHSSLRNQTLRDGGADALETAYDDLPTPVEQAASFAWFAGLATLISAERHVENLEIESALDAYRQSIERFRESIAAEPDYRSSADHYIALALAGSARLYTEGGSWEAALEAIREGLSTSPATSSMRDGLGNTPAATAGRLHQVLVEQGRATEASLLREVLESHGL